MRYPVALIDKLARVKEIHESWGSSIKYDEVVNWILQFESDDYNLAIRILENINFLNFGDIKSALSIAYSKLIRKSIDKGTKITHKNTLFAGLGDSGKSGSMISYHFRVINELSEENFDDNDDLIEAGSVENIVLIDDILSTGHQATKEILKLTEKVTPLGVKNIFLLTVCGMKEGISKIEEETKAYTFSAIEYSSKDTAADWDGKFYDGLSYEERESLKKKIEYYGKIAYPKNPLGYGQVGGLIAFDFNTPNTTLPVIWSDFNSWIPLFRRARRINGIKAYYSQFEKSKQPKTGPDATPDPQEEKQLLIYVEGKTEETFFDILSQDRGLADALGYNKVNIIALGGAILSDKLIAELANSKNDKIVILEKDLQAERASGIYQKHNIKYVFMQPNILGFFRIKDIIKNESERQRFEAPSGYEITTNTYFDFERALRIRYSPSHRVNILKEYIDRYFNHDAYKDFIDKIKTELEKNTPSHSS